MDRRYYPIAQPSLTSREKELVMQAIDSGWISSKGEFLDAFEANFAERCGAPDALAVANGTVALHLVLAAAGVTRGDEVVVPSLTYVATANAVRYCGAEPIFVGVSPVSLCIDPVQVEAAIGPRTVAVVAVDVYGHPANYDALSKICDKRGVLLIADAAEALLATSKGRPTGSLAPASTFSFFGNKVMTSGEGGCVTVKDGAFATKMRQLRNQGADPDRRYYFPVVGYNYRLTNLAAALLCAQLERVNEMLQHRRLLLAAYEEGLSDSVLVPRPVVPGIVPSPWLAAFMLPPDARKGARDQLVVALSEANVETRPFFQPIHTLPPYVTDGENVRGDMGFTMDVASRGLNLPTYVDLQVADVHAICGRVNEALLRL